ncbi:CPBP family intramembrane glutamic endopeptidase [Haladaptatus sp. NG-WS-4]
MSITTDAESGAGETRETQSPARILVLSVGLTVAALLASVAGGVALAIPVLLFERDIQSVSSLLVLTAAGQLGFLAVGYGYARYADVQVRIAVPDRRDVGYIVGGAVGALVLAVGLSVLLSLLDLVPGSVIAEAGTTNPTLFLGLAILSVVLVAPAEEFLFRGVIQTRLRQAFGPVGAIAGASLLFGSMHLANYTGNVVSIVAGALLIASVGGVFGMLYERTSNLTVSILAHGTYNVVLFVVAFLTS